MKFNIYLIVKEYDVSLEFYEKLLMMKVSKKNDRFAQFLWDNYNISINNALYDTYNSDKVVTIGNFNELDNTAAIAKMNNTHKIVLNFYTDNLVAEHNRIKQFVDDVSNIKCISIGEDEYWYFNFLDPDENIIEITGIYK